MSVQVAVGSGTVSSRITDFIRTAVFLARFRHQVPSAWFFSNLAQKERKTLKVGEKHRFWAIFRSKVGENGEFHPRNRCFAPL
jgi:hypothetical protein